jgi:23S rRNA (uracil1939-C5)-methyltransferase
MNIQKLSSSGAGVAEIDQQKYFFPFTAPSDEVELICAPKSKNLQTSEFKITSKSTNRSTPPCIYYEKCGGCSMQHLDESTYYNFKKDLGTKALSHINQAIDDFSLVKTTLNSRRRATLKASLENNEVVIGFFGAKSNNIINIDICILLEQEINALIPALKTALLSFNKIHFSQSFIEISITNCVNGLDLIFKSKYEISSKERSAIKNLAPLVIRATWQKDNINTDIFTHDDPYIYLNDQQVFLPINSFLQPTFIGQEAIIAFILKHATTSKNIIDIFAGIGTYSIALASHENSKVLAVEGNLNIKHSLQNFPNISYEIRDLYKKPLKKEKLSQFDFAVINPPRNGASPQIKNLADSTLKDIILVSCSYETFSRDSKILIDAGFYIEDFMLVDQFLFTAHIELVAYFKR